MTGFQGTVAVHLNESELAILGLALLRAEKLFPELTKKMAGALGEAVALRCAETRDCILKNKHKSKCMVLDAIRNAVNL